MHGKKDVDMLQGPLGGKLLTFALPIAAGSMLQQMFNAADTAVVGRFAGDNALAAVGTNGEIVALLVSLSLGLSMGANVLLASLVGEKKTASLTDAVHTALCLALAVGLAGALLGQWLARPLLTLLHTPPSVLPPAVRYLRIYFAGYPALLFYDFGAAILRSRGDSRRPFLLLLLAGAVNVVLNLFFVVVCGLGVEGVALATDLSMLCAALLVLKLLREDRPAEGRASSPVFRRGDALRMLKIGIPAALQGAVFCLANIFVQGAVNHFGKTVVAGSAIAVNFEYFAYYMITAFGQAATTFTSQNHAAGNRRRCRTVLRLCLLFALLLSTAVTTGLTIFRGFAAGCFSPEPGVIQAACQRILAILVFEPVCSLYEVPAGYLRGTGRSALPAGLTVAGICLLRILWVKTVFWNRQTLQSLYAVFPLSWAVTTVLLGIACFWCLSRDRM